MPDYDDLVRRIVHLEREQELDTEFRRNINIGRKVILWFLAAIGATVMFTLAAAEKLSSLLGAAK